MMTDQQLLDCLTRFPNGSPITLYHVDATGNTVAALEQSNGQLNLRSGEFWFTTNVETRQGFKGGAGLSNVIAFQVDRRFVMLLAELAQDQRTGALAEKGMKLFFDVDLAVPRVNFEGGGAGKSLPAGDVNIALRMTKNAPEFNRLFQLSTRQTSLLRLDRTMPAGRQLVPTNVFGLQAGRGATVPEIGAGGTPGFNQANATLIAGAHAYIKGGLTKISQDMAMDEALATYSRDERDILKIMNDNPLFGVSITFYFQFQPGVNKDFPDTWTFEEMTYTSMASGYQGAIIAMKPRGELKSVTIILPAIKAGALDGIAPKAKAAPPVTEPGWLGGYREISSLLGASTSNVTKCIQILNGSPMYDILPIVNRLEDDRWFTLLENKLIETPGIWPGRLKAAFWAVRCSWNSGDAFAYYKSSCNEFNSLPADQQNDIQQFITAARTKAAAKT